MKTALSSTFTKTFLASVLACAGGVALACPGARAAGQTSAVNVLRNLNSATGKEALNGLLKATDGNYYGTTYEGGSDNHGVIYKLTPAGQYSVLHSFKDEHLSNPPVLEGENPKLIIQGRDGNLYGICSVGGAFPNTPDGAGTFFRLTLAGVYTKLYDFDRGNDNSDNNPVALVQGGDGNFYGLSAAGGKTGLGLGAYWRLTPDGKTFTELFAFTDKRPGVGGEPLAQLLVGKDGSFYGTTSDFGGDGKHSTDASGTIFKATTAGAVTLVHAFQEDEEGIQAPPRASSFPLIQAGDGTLYGATNVGGNQDFGTVFKCTTAGVFTLLHDFADEADGAAPNGPLVQGSDANFYGGLQSGFPAHPDDENLGPGGLYQIKATGVLTVIHKFSATSKTGPFQPFGNLVEITKGVFDGVTAGGTNQDGTIIKMTVSPAVVSPATATATEGEAFSYQIKATNGPTGYGVSGLPKGLTVDAESGLISGSLATTGTRTMTLEARNGGGTGTRTLTLTVNAP